jgi:hypothetical protein
MPAKKEKTESPKKAKTNVDKSLSVPKRMKPINDKRVRKEIQRFSEESPESSRSGPSEVTIRKGKGKKLEDCANVLSQINKRGKNDELLRMIHGLLICRVNKKIPVKSNLKQFSGITYEDEKGREKFEAKLERHKLRDLRDIARFFGQDDSGEKEDLIKVIANFVEKPTPSERSYSSPKKSASKRKRSSSSSPKKSSGEKKSKRRKKDPDAPKRPMTAYLLFSQEHRVEAKKKLGSDAKLPEIAKKLGKMWAKAPEDEKKKFEKKAASAKEKYDKEMKKYKAKSSSSSKKSSKKSDKSDSE